MIDIQLSERQEIIVSIVKNNQPITSEKIAGILNLSRSTIRPDLSVLTMSGILDARPRVGYFFTGKTGLNLFTDEVKSIIVEKVMSMPIVVDESTSMYDAVVAIFLENVSSIYITDKGILSGVVSRKDIIRTAMGGTDLHHVPVGVIMTRMPNVVYIRPEDSLLKASERLIEHEINSLPVVEAIDEKRKQFKVIGRITKTTVTRLFVELGNRQ